ncbi:MAG: hypothetical protein JNG88_04195 [Phycisphaerales bacterium]|nr:hypothetical protein [Phycisphaerales bacterium]
MPEQSEPSPRGIWSGTITFGLVTVPVELFTARRAPAVRARTFGKSARALRRRFVCPAHQRILEPDEIVRGYEHHPGEYVAISDKELESLAPRKSRDIDLREFVDLDQIPSTYFERGYYLTPAGDANKAYRLLAEVLGRRRQAGIATFVMREREYLAAIISEGKILRAQILRFSTELREMPMEGSRAAKNDGASKRVAKALAKKRGNKLDLSLLENEDERRLRRLLDEKIKRGRDTLKVRLDESDEPGELDLIGVLRKSMIVANGREEKLQIRRPAPSRMKRSSGANKKVIKRPASAERARGRSETRA